MLSRKQPSREEAIKNLLDMADDSLKGKIKSLVIPEDSKYFVLPSSDLYYGQFTEGYFSTTANGNGTAVYKSDGSVYTGQFKDDLFHG